jgi:hypothetical protein
MDKKSWIMSKINREWSHLLEINTPSIHKLLWTLNFGYVQPFVLFKILVQICKMISHVQIFLVIK